MKHLLALFAAIILCTQAQAGTRMIRATVWNEHSDQGAYFCNPKTGELIDACCCCRADYGPEVTASSQYGGKKEPRFAPENAHDYRVETAWVEGARGYGIGESLKYTYLLDKDSYTETIDNLVIVNGYRKSTKLWKENSRVRTLRMYVNNRPFRLIRLKDTPHVQTVNFPKIKLKPGRKTVIKFEIVDVYKGTKYKDTAISDIVMANNDDRTEE